MLSSSCGRFVNSRLPLLRVSDAVIGSRRHVWCAHPRTLSFSPPLPSPTLPSHGQLEDTKSVDGKTTLMAFFVGQLERAGLADVASELPDVPRAKAVTMSAVDLDIAELSKGANVVGVRLHICIARGSASCSLPAPILCWKCPAAHYVHLPSSFRLFHTPPACAAAKGAGGIQKLPGAVRQHCCPRRRQLRQGHGGLQPAPHHVKEGARKIATTADAQIIQSHYTREISAKAVF